MAQISKVLIANRGEIAVRIIRAARDAGIGTVAVYADQDRDARHVRLADEAYALGGSTSAETYLVIDKLLAVARRSGANAVHPGYGFLAENADFAQAVMDTGLIWIGPSPDAIRALGDKVSARHIAESVGAPLAPGTLNPVETAEEVLAFADEVGVLGPQDAHVRERQLRSPLGAACEHLCRDVTAFEFGRDALGREGQTQDEIG